MTDKIWSIAPYFIVDDVVSTANFYRDKLGFNYDRFWGEPPCFAMVRRSGIVIMLAQFETTGVMRPNSAVDLEGGAWDAYVWVEQADTLYAEFKSKGVTIRPRNLRPGIRLPRFRHRRLQRLQAVFRTGYRVKTTIGDCA